LSSATTLQPGLVSITFRQLTPEQVIELVGRAGLVGIEWGGDVHVPHGDEVLARRVGELTRAAGLHVAAYGSYFRAGHSEQEGLLFSKVLASARALEAPVIRIWAGTRGSADSDAAHRDWVVSDCRRVAAMAADAGIRVALEYHGGTLTDDLESARQLLESAGHPNLRSLWQPRNGASVPQRLRDLEVLKPWLEHVHVFHWSAEGKRLPLEQGAEWWKPSLQKIREILPSSPVLMEFVEGNEPEAFLRDATALRAWIQDSV
jgi:3-dehydroshikimate dehydratase